MAMGSTYTHLWAGLRRASVMHSYQLTAEICKKRERTSLGKGSGQCAVSNYIMHEVAILAHVHVV